VSDPADAEPVVLAVDGGSTKTDAVLVGLSGTLLGRARVGPSNHQLVGVDAMLESLGDAVGTAAGDARFDVSDAEPVARLGVFCLAGLDLPVDDASLTPAIESKKWASEVLLRNDTFAVSRAGTTSPWGIGVVCGTGVNCAGVGRDGRTVRFPALAELSGDFAPGVAWLGVRALGLALRAGDGRGPATSLSEQVPAYFGLEDAVSVLGAIYAGELAYNRLFELARVLLDAAAAGDVPAREAADTLADEVVTFVRAAVNRLGVAGEEVEVVLGGGIFETSDQNFHDRVAHGIRDAAPRAKLVRLDAPPVLGAALIGLDTLGATADAKLALRAQLVD
jgi:N-acetylglucosamine kinase-like BadF-type ATPase